jgi:hypothetical protein
MMRNFLRQQLLPAHKEGNNREANEYVKLGGLRHWNNLRSICEAFAELRRRFAPESIL